MAGDLEGMGMSLVDVVIQLVFLVEELLMGNSWPMCWNLWGKIQNKELICSETDCLEYMHS